MPSHRPATGRAAPLWPGLSPLRDLGGLEGEARASAHRANVRVREADARAYEAYLEAYLAGARRSRTPDELRAYGRPANCAAGLESGSRIAEDMELQHAYDVQQHAQLQTSKELADLVLRLERRPVPLDVFFDLSLTAKLVVGGRGYGGTLSTRDGAAPHAGAAGIRVQPGKAEVGVDAGVAGAAATFGREGLESVEVSATAVPGVRAVAKQSRGAVEQGIAIGGKAGGKGGGPALEVEARASVGVTLMTREVVQRAISPRSWWDEK